MRKRLKLGRPSHGTVVAYLALFIAIGGSAYAAKQLPKNSVGTKQLKKNAVTKVKIRKNSVNGPRVKNNSLTGADIKLTKLGTVPSARSAATAGTANTANAASTANTANVANSANTLAPSEAWHEVGAPGEPGFLFSWENASPTAAFYKDHEGIVHLKGTVSGGTEPFVFNLPPGYRPANGEVPLFALACGGCAGGAAPGQIFGTGAGPSGGGAVAVPGEIASLDGISFRAES